MCLRQDFAHTDTLRTVTLVVLLSAMKYEMFTAKTTYKKVQTGQIQAGAYLGIPTTLLVGC